jgi:hypothetical protein
VAIAIIPSFITRIIIPELARLITATSRVADKNTTDFIPDGNNQIFTDTSLLIPANHAGDI